MDRASWVRRLVAAGLLAAGAAVPGSGSDLPVAVAAALLLALGEIGHELSRLLLPDLDPLERAVASFALAVAFATTVATGLGHWGALRPPPFLLLVAATALAIPVARLVARRGRRAPAVAAGERPAAARTEARPSSAATPRVAGPPPAPPHAVAGPVAPRPRGGWWRAERALAAGGLLLLAGVWLHEALTTFDLPPGRGGDDLSYHLSAVAVWARHGDLRMIKFSMGDWSTAFYPILPELASWTLLAPLGTNDALARWSALPFALAAFAAVAAVARRLGCSWRGAALAVAGYGAVRSLVAHAFTAGNDHPTAFFTLAALVAALAAAERPLPGRLAYLGVTLGGLAACKYIGLYNLLTVAVVFALALLAERPRLERPLRGALALAAAALLVGGYTYARNALATGNPVYPQGVSLFGLELPGAEEASLASRLREDDARIDVPHFLTQRSELFGSHFPWTLLPAALLAPLLALLWGPRRHAAVLALPAVHFLMFVFLMHDHREARYFLAGVALAGVAFAWLLERIPERWGPAVRSACWLALLMPLGLLLERPGWVEVVLVGAALAAGVLVTRPGAVGWFRRRGPTTLRWAPLAAAAAVAVGLAVGMPEYREVRARAQPAAAFLEELLGNAGGPVGYAGYNAPYPFFGSRLQNDVHVVPREVRPDEEYFTWGGSPDLPFSGGYRTWRASLELLGIRHVVVARGHAEEPERGWMAGHPVFERVYDDGTHEIWRLHPDAAGGRWREWRADRRQRRSAAGIAEPRERPARRRSERR